MISHCALYTNALPCFDAFFFPDVFSFSLSISTELNYIQLLPANVYLNSNKCLHNLSPFVYIRQSCFFFSSRVPIPTNLSHTHSPSCPNRILYMNTHITYCSTKNCSREINTYGLPAVILPSKTSRMILIFITNLFMFIRYIFIIYYY
jgi:hypothetical protein